MASVLLATFRQGQSSERTETAVQHRQSILTHSRRLTTGLHQHPGLFQSEHCRQKQRRGETSKLKPKQAPTLRRTPCRSTRLIDGQIPLFPFSRTNHISHPTPTTDVRKHTTGNANAASATFYITKIPATPPTPKWKQQQNFQRVCAFNWSIIRSRYVLVTYFLAVGSHLIVLKMK